LLCESRRAALVEFQGHWWIEPETFARVRRGIRNTLVTLGMLDAPLDRPLEQIQVGTEEELVRAPHAGLFVPLAPLERRVRRGELLGYLLDLDTGARTDIVSPIDGATWLVSRIGPQSDVVLEDLHAYADAGDILALIKYFVIIQAPLD
jgi:predicted deacylase